MIGRNAYADRAQSAPCHLYHEPLNRGGYDARGVYWGTGERLYCAYNAEGFIYYVRADDRPSAKAQLKKQFKGITFLR